MLHKSLQLNKICAFNKQIILIINLLPKQLVINYNLVINDLVLTAWGSSNQTLIIHGVIKFIGAPPPFLFQRGCRLRGQSLDLGSFLWMTELLERSGPGISIIMAGP